MKKFMFTLMASAALLLIISCAVALPQDEIDEKADLTVKLDISEKIDEKSDVSVDVSLTLDGSFFRNISLSRSESSKTETVAAVEYKVLVRESELFDFDYPETIKIEKDKDNTLVIKVLPKGSLKDPESPGGIVTPSGKGILDIDFCNVFDATMHYSIYNYYDTTTPILEGDTKTDIRIYLEPGKYKIGAELVNPVTGIKLSGLNDDLGYVDTEYPIDFYIKEGKKTFQGYYIQDTKIGARESRIAIDPTIGKELLGKNNAYGHDAYISYTIKYGTGLANTWNGDVYEDTLVELGYEFIPAQYYFNLVAKEGDLDVSDQYVIDYNYIYANEENLQGQTYTKPISIYRGKPITFEIDKALDENQKLIISCQQFYTRDTIEDEEGRFKIAYDIPFNLEISIYEKSGEDWNYKESYFKGTGITISEGCDSVYRVERNQGI